MWSIGKKSKNDLLRRNNLPDAHCAFNVFFLSNMADNQIHPQLYAWFDVADYVKVLEAEKKIDELKRLNDTIASFILTQGVEDLSQEARKKLENEEIIDGNSLYTFFTQHIKNFTERLQVYGRVFRSSFVH